MIASPSTYPCQWVSDSFRFGDSYHIFELKACLKWMFSSTFSLFLILPSLFCSLTFIESLHCLHGARLMIEQQTLIGFWDRLWHRFQELPKYHHTSLFTTSLHKLSDEPTFGNDSKNCHQGHHTSLFPWVHYETIVSQKLPSLAL